MGPDESQPLVRRGFLKMNSCSLYLALEGQSPHGAGWWERRPQPPYPRWNLLCSVTSDHPGDGSSTLPLLSSLNSQGSEVGLKGSDKTHLGLRGQAALTCPTSKYRLEMTWPGLSSRASPPPSCRAAGSGKAAVAHVRDSLLAPTPTFEFSASNPGASCPPFINCTSKSL